MAWARATHSLERAGSPRKNARGLELNAHDRQAMPEAIMSLASDTIALRQRCDVFDDLSVFTQTRIGFLEIDRESLGIRSDLTFGMRHSRKHDDKTPIFQCDHGEKEKTNDDTTEWTSCERHLTNHWHHGDKCQPARDMQNKESEQNPEGKDARRSNGRGRGTNSTP